MTTRRRRTRAVVLACLAYALLGCGAQDDSGPKAPADEAAAGVGPGNLAAGSAADDEATKAIKKAYATLCAGKYDALSDVITELETTREAHPDHARLAFFAGTMRLWRATGRDAPLAEVFKDVNPALKLFERAHELDPNEPHIGPFLGITQMGFGNAGDDDELRAQGRKNIEDAIRLYPPYVNGVLMQGLGALPRKHPHFADAKKAVLAAYGGCGYSAAQRAALDFPYPEGLAPGACWNGGIVLHVWEGSLLIAGDIFVKSGDAEGARRLYDTAKTSPTYDHWPFGKDLDRRIAEVDERLALYLDGDDANDPPTWVDEPKLCVGCHADQP